MRGHSAHRDERDAFALRVAADALGAGIEDRFAIDQESVEVMAVMEGHLEKPGPVGLAVHRMGLRIPGVKVADQADVLCGGSDTNEVDGPDHLFGRVTDCGGGLGLLHRD